MEVKVYETRIYQKTGVQFSDIQLPDGSFPSFINAIGDYEIPIYRDTQGVYGLAPTEDGQRTLREGQFLLLERAGIPITPEQPAVPEVPASGSIKIKGTANGDGYVGFTYKGIIYGIEPAANDTKEATALALGNLINVGNQMSATVSGDTITMLVLPGVGADGNFPSDFIDADAVDSAQTIEINSGMSGGVDSVPYQPEQPAQPPLFSVWDEDDFHETYVEV